MLPALLSLALAQAAPADKQDLRVSGHAGFSALVERGQWTPIVIDLDHVGKDDLDLVLSVVWAQPGSMQGADRPTLASLSGAEGPIHRLSVPVAARSRKRLSLTLRAAESDRLSCWVVAEHAKTGKTLAAGELLARSLAADKRLIVTVGTDRPAGLELPGLLPAAVTPEHLPEDWRGYASVDTLLWLDARASDVRSQTQIDAIAAWVAVGGRLVVARSSEVGLAGTPLAELLPVAVRGARELPELSGLAALARSAPSGRALVLEAAPGPRGTVLAAQDGLALAVGADRGLGRVIFTGLDPAREPFSSWKDAPRFWQALLPTRARAARPDPMSGMNTTGRWQPKAPDSIGEMPIAQLAGQFPDVAPPAIGGLFVLIVAYLIVVGPFDYFLLRKLKKLELTWITFPAYVAGFTLLILVAGGAFIERAAYQRELTVEDHLADAGLVRTRTLSSVLAPRGILYTLRDAEPISSNYLISNLHGGGVSELGSPVLRRDEGMLLERWSVPRGATALVSADRAQAAKGVSFRITAADGSSVTVDVRNPTGQDLFAPSLVTPKGVYELAPIGAGDFSVGGLFRHPTVEAWINSLPAVAMPNPEYGYYGGRPPSGSQSVETLDLQGRQALLRCTFLERAPSGFAETLDLRRVRDAGRPILVAWARPAKSAVSFDPAPDRLSGVRMIRAFEEPK